MKNINLTQLDPNQILQAIFQEDKDAQRVVLVGGEKLDITVDSNKIAEAIRDGLKNITVPSYNERLPSFTNAIPIEKNIFIPQIEIKTIEIPTIIKEIEYREIEKPIYIDRFVTVDKPIIIKETEFRYIEVEKKYPKILKITAVVQAIGVICILLMNFFKR